MNTITTTNSGLVRYSGGKFVLSNRSCPNTPDIVFLRAGEAPIQYGDLLRLLIRRGERELYGNTLVVDGNEFRIRDMSADAFWSAVKDCSYEVIARSGLYAVNPECLRASLFSGEEEVLSFAISAFESGDNESAFSVLVPATCYTLIPLC